MSLKPFVKRNAPAWVIAVLSPLYRSLRSRLGPENGVLARQDAMLRVMEQRMAELERVCVRRVDELEGRLDEVVVPGLLQRQDDALRLIHQEVEMLHAALAVCSKSLEEQASAGDDPVGEAGETLDRAGRAHDSGRAAS